MNYRVYCLACIVLIGPVLSDKPADKAAAKEDSYENGVGTSYTVALNPKNTAPVSKNSRKYSVSADDLAAAPRADQQASPSSSVYSGTVNSYSAPVNNLDSTYVVANQDVAQDRDGAGGHHHDHGHHHTDHGAAAQPAAAASSYQSAPVSTGNLYYYYYPVAAYPLNEKADEDELDPLVLVLLPVALLVGFLALVSIFNVSITRSARSFDSAESWRQNEVFGSWELLREKVDTLLENYYAALESESCMDRVVCELGTQANNISGKTFLMTALDWFTPSAMQSRIDIFKDAANEGYAPHVCKSKFFCDSSNLIATRRK